MTTGEDGKPVVALSVRAPNVGWTVIAQQPLLEAFESIRAALWRSLVLIAIGIAFALVLAYWLACRMSGPIRQLEDGVERIGMGQFDHRIAIASGDELEQLANRFNEMAGELAASQQKSERIDRLKRFLAPQVAELVENSDRGCSTDSGATSSRSSATCAASPPFPRAPSPRSSWPCCGNIMKRSAPS